MSLKKICWAALLSLACVGVAVAQTAPRSYAILSLAGNSLALHASRHQVGSRTENDAKNVVAIDDQVFDQAAIIAARAVVIQEQPDAKPVLMLTQDPGLYGAQNQMFEAPDAHQEDRDYLQRLLKDVHVTHLILITKLRGVAEFKMASSTEGAGTLQGLGFYVDDMINTRDLTTNEVARGMVVPFAYVRVRLLDAATLQVLREGTAKASTILTTPSVESSGMESFNRMTGLDRATHIRQMLERAMRKSLPGLLAAGS